MSETTGSSYPPERKTSVYDDLGGGRNTYYDTGKLPARAPKKPLTGRATKAGTQRRELGERLGSVLGTGKDVTSSPEKRAQDIERLQALQAALKEAPVHELVVVEPVAEGQPTPVQLDLQLDLPLDREA